VAGEHFPVRLVVGKELSPEENLWIKSLSKGQTAKAAKQIYQMTRIIEQKIKMDAYAYVFLHANKKIFGKDVNALGFAELMKEMLVENGWTEEYEAKGIERGRVQGKIEGKEEGKIEGKIEGIDHTLFIINGIKKNIPLTQLASETNLPLSEVEKINRVLLTV
jgi:hypothetical protein